jgi:hypothetical protein
MTDEVYGDETSGEDDDMMMNLNTGQMNIIESTIYYIVGLILSILSLLVLNCIFSCINTWISCRVFCCSGKKHKFIEENAKDWDVEQPLTNKRRDVYNSSST